MKQIQLFILMLFTTFAFAQERTIEGKVVDENGEPLIGTTVRVVGTSLGALTDVDGVFSIADVPADATELRLSYLGQDTTVDITDGFMDISLNTGQVIEGVEIFTGYSKMERDRFTGSVKVVGSEPVDDKNTSDISQALAGEVSGLVVVPTDGQPGRSATVRIRGFNSVNGNKDPLYVVDGAIFNGDLSSINPTDIESTTVLKDASATAIYGARGANGVIVVTTKKGRVGDNKISANFKQGINFRGLPYYDVIQSPEEYMEIGWEGLENVYGATGANQRLFGSEIAPYYNMWDAPGDALIDPATGRFYPNVNRKYTPVRRRDAFFNNSNRTEANVSMSGGEGKTTYRTSFGVLDEEGYFLASDFTRYSGLLNIQHQVKPWLKGSMNLSYANQNSNFSGQSGASSVNGFFLERNAPPIYGIFERDSQGNRIPDPIFGGFLYDFGDEQSPNDLGQPNTRNFSTSSNIAGINAYNTDVASNGNFIGTADLVATFLQNFDFTVRVNYQNQNNKSDFLENPYYGPAARGASGVGGTLFKLQTDVRSLNALQMLSYGNLVGDHEFNISVAHESNEWESLRREASGVGLSDPNSLEFNNIINHNPNASRTRDFNLESYFAFADYSYKDKYYLNANIRRDGSSRFAQGNRWGTFGSVGLGWEVTREAFMDNVEWVDYLKVRTSVGVIGDQGSVTDPASIYQGQGNLNSNTSFGGNFAFLFSRPVDGDITWEQQNKTDFGIEADLFDGRISMNMDYYINNTENLFFDQRRGPSSGRPVTEVNSGVLQNRGFEFDITGRLVNKNDFTVDLTVLGATLSNELTEAPLNSSGEPIAIGLNGVYGFSEGKSVFDFYTREFVGVDSDTGLSQWTQFYDDINGNGVLDAGEGIFNLTNYQSENDVTSLQRTTTTDVNAATLHYTGQSAIPDIQGATRLRVGYKGLGLSANLLYRFGGHGLDGNYQALMDNTNLGDNNWHEDMRNRWQEPGDVTNVPSLTNGEGTANQANSTSTRFLTKADYLLLNNVRLSYDIPQRLFDKIGLSGARVWVSGDNLWSKSERDGYFSWNSEDGNPIREQYDPLSTFTTGVSFQF